MTRELDQPALWTRLDQVKVYLGETSVDEVRRCRELFGGVVLQGVPGLKLASLLSRIEDLNGVEVDPAQYLKPDLKPAGADEAPNLSLTLDLQPRDLVRWQHDLGLPVVRTAGRRIRVGRYDDLRAALGVCFDFDVSVLLPLDGGWFGARHIEALHDELAAANRDVSFVLADSFDPLNSAVRIAGFRQVVSWANAAGRRLDLLRTDLVGIPAVIDGVASAAIGLGTSTRHYGLPIPRKQQEDYEFRQRSPLVFVPKLMHWQRGNVLGALEPWRREIDLAACSCAACEAAGEDLLRFDMQYRSQPPEVRKALNVHTMHAVHDLVESLRSAEDPRLALKERRRQAVDLTRSVTHRTGVQLEGPPAWITSWD
jgi:hypothetical protein